MTSVNNCAIISKFTSQLTEKNVHQQIKTFFFIENVLNCKMYVDVNAGGQIEFLLFLDKACDVYHVIFNHNFLFNVDIHVITKLVIL